jgi:hypothetical protein
VTKQKAFYFAIESTQSRQKEINILNIHHEVRILTEIPFVSVEKTTHLCAPM